MAEIHAVRKIRQALNIPLIALAAECGVSPPILSRAERFQAPFYPALRRRVAAALGIPEARLFPEEEAVEKGRGKG